MWPTDAAWDPFFVQGPLGRTVEDAALLLSAMAGPDARSPISIREPGSRFADSLERDFKGVRVAWGRIAGTGLELEPIINAVDVALGKTMKEIVVWTLTTPPRSGGRSAPRQGLPGLDG